MTHQPSPPSPPGAPIRIAQDRADIAQGTRDANAVGQQAQREIQQATAQANRDIIARVGGGGNTSVIKDGGGRIVVTGPDGKTITIDPRAGLDGDQIQEMVQTALQPAHPLRGDEGPSKNAVTIIAIIFSFLLAAIWLITRAVRRRPAPAGSATAVLPPETVARLARIEQAVEAVAIEVERISEAQRYSAQLLTDRLPGVARTAPAIAAARGDHG